MTKGTLHKRGGHDYSWWPHAELRPAETAARQQSGTLHHGAERGFVQSYKTVTMCPQSGPQGVANTRRCATAWQGTVRTPEAGE